MPQKTFGNHTKVEQCFNWLNDALQHSQVVAYAHISIIVPRQYELLYRLTVHTQLCCKGILLYCKSNKILEQKALQQELLCSTSTEGSTTLDFCQRDLESFQILA